MSLHCRRISLAASLTSRPARNPLVLSRRYLASSESSSPPPSSRSRHAQWYTDMLPGMIPVALLGSAVYLGLHLIQASLEQERFMHESKSRIEQLEAEVATLRKERNEKRDEKLPP